LQLFWKALIVANTSFPNLLNGRWRDLPMEYFREGVQVHWLARGSEGEPSVAILKYEAGARVPLHRHAGIETIMVLEGIQSDENGHYGAGTLVLNAKGSEHSVWSEAGCTVLIQWDLPVIILTAGS
jgi:anti-sigma factor ChrR (cupin superfamily)